MEEPQPVFITTPRGGLNLRSISEYEISKDGNEVKLTTRTPTSATFYNLDGEMAKKAIEVLKAWSS